MRPARPGEARLPRPRGALAAWSRRVPRPAELVTPVTFLAHNHQTGLSMIMAIKGQYLSRTGHDHGRHPECRTVSNGHGGSHRAAGGPWRSATAARHPRRPPTPAAPAARGPAGCLWPGPAMQAMPAAPCCAQVPSGCGTPIPERGTCQLCHHQPGPQVGHRSHGEPVIARVWCMWLAHKGQRRTVVPLLILSRWEQGREDHRADETLTAERPLR
jgi:hypothetical protein